jgi:hypothetical protein
MNDNPHPPIRNVTVYCASSRELAPVYRDAAREFGAAIAKQGWGLNYGGDKIGLMGIIAAAVKEGGGRVVGILPQKFVDLGVANHQCDELIVTETMRQRKQILEHRGDALVALPGGLGTLEEIFEVIVGKQLGFHNKPLAILNVVGYYDPLLAMIEHGIEHRFIRREAKDLFFVARTVKELVDYLLEPAAAPQAAADPLGSARE